MGFLFSAAGSQDQRSWVPQQSGAGQGEYLLVSSGIGSMVLTRPFARLPPGENAFQHSLWVGKRSAVFTVIYSMYNKVNIAHA